MRGLGIRLILGLLAVGAAEAHFSLLAPASIHANDNGGKGELPCGEGVESGIVTPAQGGRPLTIRLREFIFHPGHYRVALSVRSRKELPPDPDVVQDANGISISAAIQKPEKPPVLADGLFIHTTPPNGDWETAITLPNLNCERCTLQVIQFMAEHGANDPGGFSYHHCADLKITADPSLPPADAAWPREAVPTSSAFPHFAMGGGWSTTLALVNSSNAAVAATVALRGDDGNPVRANISTTVSPNGTAFVPLEDAPGAALVKGWADVRSDGVLSGYAVLAYKSAESPPQAAAVPIPAPGALTLPFDNTAGFETSLAIVNLSAAAGGIGVTIWDETGGVLGTETLNVAPGGHRDFALPAQWAETAGKRGLVRLQGTVSAIALRFGASGSFVALPAQ